MPPHSTSQSTVKCLTLVTIVLLSLTGLVNAAPPGPDQQATSRARTLDRSTYINADDVLMFMTNIGTYARDLDDVFGYDFGTFYPYISNAHIANGSLSASPLYAAGLWLGGIGENGDTLVAMAEYDSEYWPGPMINGSYDPWAQEQTAYRVYKLYADSLENNPNQDYLDWPVEQRAPVDGFGRPDMKGNQMLWCVFNAANPDAHLEWEAGGDPLGLEIRQRVWASASARDNARGNARAGGIEFFTAREPNVDVSVEIQDVASLPVTDYKLEVSYAESIGFFWQLYRSDFPYWTLLVDTNTHFSGEQATVEVDGMRVSVHHPHPVPASYQVVANASGPLPTPVGGAFDFDGFPSLPPDSTQQVGDGIWGIHAADDGGSCGKGTNGDYEAYLGRVTRDGNNDGAIGDYDYEIRFTGTYDDPGVNGSYAIEWFNDDNVFWVPFELWRIGAGTPDDPSDDVRLIPFITDAGDDDVFGLESWGCIADPLRSSGFGDHSASSFDNDPWTDQISWILPVDDSPGEAGYLAAEAEMLAGDFRASILDHFAVEVFARTVLVNWNGHTTPDGTVYDTLTIPPIFNQQVPELGTIFRLTNPLAPRDGVVFWSTDLDSNDPRSEGASIFIEYQIFNLGGKTIDSLYIGHWLDPDIGTSTNDVASCLSADNVALCLNGEAYDDRYDVYPPAVGIRQLVGPMVPSQGDTADFAGQAVPNQRNLSLSSVMSYVNGEDPRDHYEIYHLLSGKLATGDDYLDPTTGQPDKFMFDGDPLTETGDVDREPADKRILATSGPITMLPGDSQYVMLQLSIGQGGDRLSSLSSLLRRLGVDAGGQSDPKSRCCVESTGNVDSDNEGAVTLGDLTALVDHLFVSLAPVSCADEADMSGDGKISLADLSVLVDHLFISLNPLPMCP